MKKILITGGAGFIGSHIVEYYLNKKFKVIVLDNFSTGRISNLKNFKNNKNLQIIKTDISKNKKIHKYLKNVEYVFHLASLADIVPSIEDPISYFNANVVGTINLMEAIKKHKIKKIIYSASSSCYGIPSKFPTKENEKINPQYPYALTKRLGEEIICHYSKIYNISFISLRLFNVYGPRSRTSGTYGAVFGVFLAQKIAKKPFTIVGDGNQTRDFTFVSDIVEAFHKAAHSRCKNQIFNIGSNQTYSINYLAKILKGKKIYLPKRPGEPNCTWADTKKAKKLLGWQPKINLKEGVKILMENIDYWKYAPVWDKNKIKKATKNWFKYLS